MEIDMWKFYFKHILFFISTWFRKDSYRCPHFCLKCEFNKECFADLKYDFENK